MGLLRNLTKGSRKNRGRCLAPNVLQIWLFRLNCNRDLQPFEASRPGL